MMSYFSNELAPNLFPSEEEYMEAMKEKGFTDEQAVYFLLDWIKYESMTWHEKEEGHVPWYIVEFPQMMAKIVANAAVQAERQRREAVFNAVQDIRKDVNAVRLEDASDPGLVVNRIINRYIREKI